MFYRGEVHRRRFCAAAERLGCPVFQLDEGFLAALFLLTSDHVLWNRAKNAVGVNRIDFRNIKLAGIGLNCYALYKTAEDLYKGTANVDLGDLGNTEIIGSKIFPVIQSALAIRRGGVCALTLNEKGDIA